MRWSANSGGASFRRICLTISARCAARVSIFYQSEDEDSGQFTYFAFSPDTMETTYHLEFRYAEDLSDLQSWFEGNYAYWNAAAIAEDYDQATMKNVIELFTTENLSAAE